MQKISSYLYPNRINVVANLDLFPVRWNIVYQNIIKIYTNIDNVLTIDVKNSDQKRIDISDMTLKMSITDVNNAAVATVDLVPSQQTGLATVNITSELVENLQPQFLNFTIYRENEDQTKTIFYADTQFGAVGKIELLRSAIDDIELVRYITRFNSRMNDYIQPSKTTTFSDAVELTQRNFLKAPEDESVSFEFKTISLEAIATVQFTKDPVISSGTDWIDIETFDIATTTSSFTKTYQFPVYNRELTWARVIYDRSPNNQGSIDKIIVRL
jgi:hypothetical protein